MKPFRECFLLSLCTFVALGQEDNCVMEWITVYPNAPTSATSSLGAPSGSPASSSGAGKNSQKDALHPVGSSAVAGPPSAVASAASSAAPVAAASGTTASLSPGGKKAGISGFKNIADQADWSKFTPHISWYSDYWPNTPDSGSVKGIGMLWGDGHQSSDDQNRFTAFGELLKAAQPPEYMMGFYEPDWSPGDSSNIGFASAAATWSTTLAKLEQKGTLVGSPSLAKQLADDWLGPFENTPQHPEWNFTCIHTNKNSSDGVEADVEQYLARYKKPIWVSEFSCMNDLDWTACEDPTTFIKETVKYLEGNPNVIAYGYSNGDGLPDGWKLLDSNGKITANGQTYLTALGG